MQQLVGKLQGREHEFRLGGHLATAQKALESLIHKVCQRLNIGLIGIAAHLEWLTGDVDPYRALHSGGDNIERTAKVKTAWVRFRARFHKKAQRPKTQRTTTV